jgi:hypothetical protein
MPYAIAVDPLKTPGLSAYLFHDSFHRRDCVAPSRQAAATPGASLRPSSHALTEQNLGELSDADVVSAGGSWLMDCTLTREAADRIGGLLWPGQSE